ncbi:MAG: hypothetical protein ACRDZ4_23760 [Egibacteraceae bacterium]
MPGPSDGVDNWSPERRAVLLQQVDAGDDGILLVLGEGFESLAELVGVEHLPRHR